MIDVDHFKRINDQYGHLAGDAVLREVAQRIDAEMRISDTGARFGGDEFAMVLLAGDRREASASRGACCTRCAAQPIAVGQERHGDGDAVDRRGGGKPGPAQRDYKVLAERLIAEADAALYRAKSAGRNRHLATSPNVVTASRAPAPAAAHARTAGRRRAP